MFARSIEPTSPARPFLKWAGGKSQLLPQLKPLFPRQFRRYLEPFVGGGAVYFHLQPRSAILADSNEELINCYRVVRSKVDHLIDSLRRHRYESDYFYELRGIDPATLSDVQRASRFIFLNKTCYNGLYRVNRSNQFNVPFGRYAIEPRFCDPENLRAVSRALCYCELVCSSFEHTIQQAEPADFVYLDPPYQPLGSTSNFTHYTQFPFAEFDQRWLAEGFRRLTDRGAYVLLNNSDTPLVRWLYQGFKISEAMANRAINSDPGKRQSVVELIITNY